MSSVESKELHIERHVPKLVPPRQEEIFEFYDDNKLDVNTVSKRRKSKSIRPTKCYSWEFNHAGNNMDRNGRALGTSWEKLSLNLNFILDSLEMNDGPKAYRYISKGSRCYIADIKNMQLVRLGENNKPLKAWPMRKILLDEKDRDIRKKLHHYQTEVYCNTRIEVTEICTKRQRFEIKGFINVYWQATLLNKEDIKDDNLEEVKGKTYCKIKKLKDRKLNVPISLSDPIRNAIHKEWSTSAIYYKDRNVILLVIKIESATLHENMSLRSYPFDRQFLNICLSCRRTVKYKFTPKNSPKYSNTDSSPTIRDLNMSDWQQSEEVKKVISNQRSLEVKHSGWVWTATCPRWIPVSQHFHLIKIPVHAKLQGSVADEWKMHRPWCDYVWGLFLDTCFIRIPIERHSTYHLSHTAGPLFMIVTAAFGAFFVPIDAVDDRLSVSLTAMLTAVAFQFNVANQLPDAGYSTLIDKYILYAFFTLFVVISENMLMGSIALEGWAHHEDIDKLLGGLMFGLWVIYNIAFYINALNWFRVDWNELSKKELTSAGVQWFCSNRENCADIRLWGVVGKNCQNIHPQGECVNRPELIEETKRLAIDEYSVEEEPIICDME